MFPHKGDRIFTRYLDRWWVGEFIEETICLKGQLALWIFRSPYNWGWSFVGSEPSSSDHGGSLHFSSDWRTSVTIPFYFQCWVLFDWLIARIIQKFPYFAVVLFFVKEDCDFSLSAGRMMVSESTLSSLMAAV